MTIKEKMQEMKKQATIIGERAGEECALEALKYIETLLLVYGKEKIAIRLAAGNILVSHNATEASRSFYRTMDYRSLEEKNAHQAAFLKKVKEIFSVEGITFADFDASIDRFEFFA